MTVEITRLGSVRGGFGGGVDLVGGEVAVADVADLPGGDQAVERLERFVDRDGVVGCVLLVRIDVVGAEAAQAALGGPGDKYLTRMVPAGRLGTGDDIAQVAAFLCSDAASYVTGQVVGVNGGAVT